MGLLILVVLGGVIPARGQDAAQQMERSFYYIDRLGEATELFNAGRPAEALPIFQELAAGYADLDEDGFAALSVGDCLVALGRRDEARAAYQTVMASRPEIAAAAEDRLIDLEISGEPSDALLDRLRLLAQTPGREQFASQIRLGRALQKRARALLSEAVETFKTAVASTEGSGLLTSEAWLTRHAELLDELNRDLSRVIERSEARWRLLAKPGRGGHSEQAGPLSIVSERLLTEWLVRTGDGQQLEFRLRGERDTTAVGSPRGELLLNGRHLELTPEERAALGQYQEQIHAILLQAANRSEGQERK